MSASSKFILSFVGKWSHRGKCTYAWFKINESNHQHHQKNNQQSHKITSSPRWGGAEMGGLHALQTILIAASTFTLALTHLT